MIDLDQLGKALDRKPELSQSYSDEVEFEPTFWTTTPIQSSPTLDILYRAWAMTQLYKGHQARKSLIALLRSRAENEQ